ncbi:hypothetical protein HYT57_03855 [Candidatus Woesearchaeota archaeon]|nr:hypothetical protein [Candidatus Woesearchaeota archaeon]
MATEKDPREGFAFNLYFLFCRGTTPKQSRANERIYSIAKRCAGCTSKFIGSHRDNNREACIVQLYNEDMLLESLSIGLFGKNTLLQEIDRVYLAHVMTLRKRC